MKKIHAQRATAFLIAFLLSLCAFLPALALDNVSVRTVRVGYYHIEGYNVMDEAGDRSGYGYEVLQAMKLYTNWVYEYIGYDKGWADMQQMLLDGEIDMVITAVKTPERAEIYDFSDLAVSQSGACLSVKAGESPYVAGQYDGYNGMRIGFIENASQIAKTEAFAAEKGFTYQPVYYKTSGELESAIQSGRDVDAIVTSNLRIISGTRRLELFAMQDVHAMVQKGNAELLAEINYALRQISLYSPNLYDSLYDKYYTASAGDAVFFSPEESAFLEAFRAGGQTLRVAIRPNMSPYSYYNGDTPSGILYDIATEALRRAGLTGEVAVTSNDEAYLALQGDESVDLWLTALFDYNNAEKLGYTLTNPYFTTDVSRVTRKGSAGNVRSIAVLENSVIQTDYLPTFVTDELVTAYATAGECVNAVLSGKCDALYLFTRTAQEVVYADETNRLTSVIMPRFSAAFSIGVHESRDARLASILEKAVASITEDDVAAIVLKYTDYPQRKTSLRGMLYNDPFLIIVIVVLLLAAVFTGIMLSLTARKRALERDKNRQLQAALSAAEQANLAKSMFMSRMSHEIRTPLNAIIGYNSISVNALTEAKSEPAYRQATMKAMDCLSKSDIASKQLLTVINDVLDMSAIESNKVKIAHEPFDFKAAISTLTVMFYTQAKAKDVDFQVLFHAPTDEWFLGDEMRLNQILTNLLSNAVKFTPGGGSVRLTIGEAPGEGEAARIRFEVADTGIGISKDFLQNIWAPFEQADASISRRFGGTGLGLSITKNLVDLMGGTIRAESEPGVGSTFQVELPLGRMTQPMEEAAYDFSAINALVVDDDRSTCDYLKLLFNRYDVKCTATLSGKEAVDAVADGIAKNDPYTLCIVDWHMPEMSGLETIKRIKTMAGAELPIVIISAYDFTEIEPNAKTVGVDTFIAKPLFQSAIFDLLVNIGGKRREVARKENKANDFHGARVLLAEDNKMNMEIAKAILCHWNLTVDMAWNGLEAANLFFSAPAGTYQAILMDVHMPEMDGYSATQKIRTSDYAEAATIPIIAMTADVFAEDVSQAMAAGMNDHVGKPIDRDVLYNTLRKYLS